MHFVSHLAPSISIETKIFFLCHRFLPASRSSRRVIQSIVLNVRRKYAVTSPLLNVCSCFFVCKEHLCSSISMFFVILDDSSVGFTFLGALRWKVQLSHRLSSKVHRLSTKARCSFSFSFRSRRRFGC